MGAAAAWAATQSPAFTLITFASVGAGMALPYVVLAANPKLVDRMPRTGPGSELIKQIMGLLILAAAAFFLGTGLSGLLVQSPDPPTRLYWWPVMLLIAAAGAWLILRTWRITARPRPRAIFTTLGALAIVASLYGGVRLTDKGPIDWVYYTPERFAEAQQRGDVIVLDFTAEWCLNCKYLEQTYLNSDAVAALLNGRGVTPIKVDITGYNPVGRAKLTAMGRLTIPLLVVFDGQGREVFKSDAYTAEQVVAAIEMARR